MTLVLCTALLCAACAVGAADLTGSQYLSLRQSLDASSPEISALKSNAGGYIGKVVELKGTVNGIARCGDAASLILNCDGESLLIRMSPDAAPKCIANGNTIRALVKLGPACVASLSDLHLQGAAYDYHVTSAEKQIAEKTKPQASTPQKQPVPPSANSKEFRAMRQDRAANLSSRAVQVYEPYKQAIAKLNPKLTSEQLETITASILAFSEKYGVDPRLIVSIFLVESGFKPTATSPKGAMGLGQLMPGTARGLGVSNAYDLVQNVEASIRLISGHLKKYRGDLSLALSAYNAGPGAVKKYNGVPPYRETQNYIRKVGQIYKALCGK